MNADDRAHWLEPSRPIAVDGDERARPRAVPDGEQSDEAPASEETPERQNDDARPA
jgi:hypothetical protein